MRLQTKLGRLTARRLTAMLLAAGGTLTLVMAGQAHAQTGATEARRERPPIRASATVEVIDPARGVDDIISRVRDQKDKHAASKERSKDDSANRAGGDDDDKPRRSSGSGSGAGTSSAGNGSDRADLKPDKNDRPNAHGDRDRREPRRQDGDTRQTLPRDRTHWNRR